MELDGNYSERLDRNYSARLRSFNWSKKMIRRKTRGTGRMRYEKSLPRKAKNGFREHTAPKPRTKNKSA